MISARERNDDLDVLFCITFKCKTSVSMFTKQYVRPKSHTRFCVWCHCINKKEKPLVLICFPRLISSSLILCWHAQDIVSTSQEAAFSLEQRTTSPDHLKGYFCPYIPYWSVFLTWNRNHGWHLNEELCS